MDKKRRLTKKYILLAILLIAVFVLPSCRTRISNNSEIANVQYDEDGMMSETYQERRDELGLSTAEKPLLPNLGSAETDDNDEFAEGSESIDYNPEDFQEDFSEPETTTETNTNTNTTTNSGTRTTTRRTPTTTRRTTGTTTSTVSVTFNANGGTIDGKKSKTVSIKKGNKIGTLPTPKHDNANMAFEGWFTSKEGGSSVKSTDKVSSSTILYAHWKDNTPAPAKTYTLSLKDEEGTSEASIKEGESFKLPDGAKKVGYDFIGWTTEPDGKGTLYEKGSKVTMTADLTLHAYYEPKGPEEYWQDMFDNASKDEMKYAVAWGDGEDTKVIQNSGGKNSSADSANFIIGFVGDDEDIEQVANDLKTAYSEKTVVVIPKNTNKASGAEKVLYEVYMLNTIQGKSVLKLSDAESDLGVTSGDLGIVIK